VLPELAVHVSLLCPSRCVSPPQAKLRNMEKQVEWVRAERDELAASAAADARELGARVKEGEAALTRLKVGPPHVGRPVQGPQQSPCSRACAAAS
jgi:hypothetical protein